MKKFPVIDMRATGTRIKEIRSSQNFTVQEISEYMGFENPQAVYKWQTKKRLDASSFSHMISSIGTSNNLLNANKLSTVGSASPLCHL